MTEMRRQVVESGREDKTLIKEIKKKKGLKIRQRGLQIGEEKMVR